MFILYLVLSSSYCNNTDHLDLTDKIIDDNSESLKTNETLCIYVNVPRTILIFNTINSFSFSVQYNSTSPFTTNGTAFSGTGVGIDFGNNYGFVEVKNTGFTEKKFKYSYTFFFQTNSKVMMSNNKIASWYSPNDVQTTSPIYFMYMGPSIIRYMVNYNMISTESLTLFRHTNTYSDNNYTGNSNGPVYVETDNLYIYKFNFSNSNSSIKVTTTSDQYPDTTFTGIYDTGSLKWIKTSDITYSNLFPEIPDGRDPPPGPVNFLVVVIVIIIIVIIVYFATKKNKENKSDSSKGKKNKNNSQQSLSPQMYQQQQPQMYQQQQPQMYQQQPPMYPQV